MTAASASQTAGPYWHLIDFPAWSDLLRSGGPNGDIKGERVILTGRVLDGAGAPVTDAMVEIWQADSDGRYAGSFHGFGRSATDSEGRYRFMTLKPGPVPGRGNALQAPHIAIVVFARGLLHHLFTRAYFAGEPLNATDPVLMSVDNEARRATMIANAGHNPAEWQFDIRLQGEGETVFLDI